MSNFIILWFLGNDKIEEKWEMRFFRDYVILEFKGFIFKRMRMIMRNENLRDYVILEF